MSDIIEIPIVAEFPDHVDENSPILLVLGSFIWKKGDDGYTKLAVFPKEEFEKPKFVRLDMKTLIAVEEEIDKMFVFNPDNNTLTLYIDYPYEIDLDRINTHQDLIGCLHHMSGKTWISGGNIHNLIELICKHKNWNIYGTN